MNDRRKHFKGPCVVCGEITVWHTQSPTFTGYRHPRCTASSSGAGVTSPGVFDDTGKPTIAAQKNRAKRARKNT